MSRFVVLALLLVLSSSFVVAFEVRYFPGVDPATKQCIGEQLAKTPDFYTSETHLLVVYPFRGYYYGGYAWYGPRRVDLMINGLPCKRVRRVLLHEMGHLVAESRGLNVHASYSEQECFANKMADMIDGVPNDQLCQAY